MTATKQREIKFRAWDKINGLVYQRDFNSLHISDSNHWSIADRRDNLVLADSRNSILEQFTGLKDKNGKEIFEGDVFRYQDCETQPIAERDIGTIGYNKAHFTYKLLRWDDDDDIVLSHICMKFLEIIGSIHENPELLKVSND